MWKTLVFQAGDTAGIHQHGVCQELMRCCQQSPAAIPHAGRVSMNYLSFWFMTQNICSEILIICYVSKPVLGDLEAQGRHW